MQAGCITIPPQYLKKYTPMFEPGFLPLINDHSFRHPPPPLENDRQWCSGGGATGAIAPVPTFQGGAPLQFLFHLLLVNFDYFLQKLAFDLDYY